MTSRSKIVLIDTRSGGDWSLDLVFAGLVRRFGPDRVIDYPPKEKHREGNIVFTGDAEADWGRERRSFGYTPYNQDISRHTQAEVATMVKRGEVGLIVTDERNESFEQYLRISAQFFDIPVVVIAGHDRFWNVSPSHVKDNMYGRKMPIMFLDNWTPEYDSLDFARVTNLSTNFDHFWERPKDAFKKYDISFMGYNSHPARKVVIDHIRDRWKDLNMRIIFETRPDTMSAFVPRFEYFEDILRSRICLNVRGAAQDGRALRFYEIPYVGSFMLSQVTNANQLHPFIEGEHCSYFDSLDEMDKKIEFYLNDEEKREKIAKRGHEHLMRFHTVDARMDYIFEVLSGQGISL